MGGCRRSFASRFRLLPDIVSAWWNPGLDRFGVVFGRQLDPASLISGASVRLRVGTDRWGSTAGSVDSLTELSWARGAGPAIDPPADVVQYVQPSLFFPHLKWADGSPVPSFQVPWQLIT